MAAGIIFIAFLQRKLPDLERVQTLQFEAGKATLATAMWLWLLLDSLFGPWANNPYNNVERWRRVQRSLISSILLLWVSIKRIEDDSGILTFVSSHSVSYFFQLWHMPSMLGGSEESLRVRRNTLELGKRQVKTHLYSGSRTNLKWA